MRPRQGERMRGGTETRGQGGPENEAHERDVVLYTRRRAGSGTRFCFETSAWQDATHWPRRVRLALMSPRGAGEGPLL